MSPRSVYHVPPSTGFLASPYSLPMVHLSLWPNSNPNPRGTDTPTQDSSSLPGLTHLTLLAGLLGPRGLPRQLGVHVASPHRARGLGGDQLLNLRLCVGPVLRCPACLMSPCPSVPDEPLPEPPSVCLLCQQIPVCCSCLCLVAVVAVLPRTCHTTPDAHHMSLGLLTFVTFVRPQAPPPSPSTTSSTSPPRLRDRRRPSLWRVLGHCPIQRSFQPGSGRPSIRFDGCPR